MFGINRKLATIITVVVVVSFFLGYTAMLAQAETETPTPTPTAKPRGPVKVEITDYKVLTIDGKDAKEPLMSGSSYKVEFTVDVAKDVSDPITLETDLERVGDRYWELLAEYKGINVASWAPGRAQITFASEEGKAKMRLTGKIPEDFNTRIDIPGKDPKDTKDIRTITKLPTGEILHLKRAVKLVRLSLASGALSEEKKMDAVDKSIETYNEMLATKKKLIEEQKGEPEYIKLATSAVKKAEDMAKLGHTEMAAALLKEIPDKGWPQPPASNMLLYAIAGLLGIAALAFFFLMVKARGASGYTAQVVDDQVKRMDIIGTKAARLGDKALVQEIKTVKEELEKVSGR